MQDAIMGLRDMIMHMGPTQMTVLMMVLSVLVAIPIMLLISRKTSLIEKALLCSLVIAILWAQWWLAGI